MTTLYRTLVSSYRLSIVTMQLTEAVYLSAIRNISSLFGCAIRLVHPFGENKESQGVQTGTIR